jgi:hypothetical protein
MVGFPVRHRGRNLLARHLECGLSYGLLVEALGLFLLLAARRPDSLDDKAASARSAREALAS